MLGGDESCVRSTKPLDVPASLEGQGESEPSE